MRDDFDPIVYLLASHRHRGGLIEGFPKDYGVHRLVWFERHATMEHAITREKRIKKWKRAWKITLIEETNPDCRDLAGDLGFDPLPSRRIA